METLNQSTSVSIDKIDELTNIIYFRDIKRLRLLPYSSNVSIKAFCSKNDIAVFGAIHKYVYAVQLHRALLNLQIGQLTKVYGEQWAEILLSDLAVCKKYKDAIHCIAPEKGNLEGSTTCIRAKNIIENKFRVDLETLLKVPSPRHE